LKGKTVFTRLRLSLAACLLIALSAGMLVGTAGAAPEAPPADASGLPANGPVFNPQETTVPYLAWRGEEVRLVKCTHELDNVVKGDPTLQTNGGFFWGLDVNMQVFSYSGPQENSFDGPKTVTNSASIFYDRATERWCVRGTWVSNKAGIVIIKLSVNYKGVQLAVHDFMIGWMAINSPRITNPGTVTEDPGTLPGNSVNVQVSGSIPLNSEFQADYGLPAQLIMPNDWALWAHSAMAQTDNNLNGLPASAYWDIHDSSGPLANESPNGSPDVHVNTTTCPGSVLSAFVDQVDNCTGSGEDFSRIFGDLTNGENGPFDPSYSSTLLSDGRLNSNDAPMPALKIVFNSSGGMGGFDNSCLNDKDNVYNSNFGTNLVAEPDADDGFGPWSCIKGTKDDQEVSPHSLYAPYYEQYIPATSRDPGGAASGIDGPVIYGQPNNFPGFGWYGNYPNWLIAQKLVDNVAKDSPCLLTTKNYDPVFRQTNGFPTSVVEFTDEHGEARAQWQPGFGNDNFGTTVGFVDNNGGCDLQGVDLGPQTITASARYPFQPVAQDVAATGSITKIISNHFQKTVSCVRKNNVSSAVAYICTATAQDIAGNGDVFNGEKVCFSREPDNIWYSVGGNNPHPNGFCEELAHGTSSAPATVSVETPATLLGSQIDVQAYFAGEKLLRDTCIVSGQPASTPGPCGAVGSTTSTTSTTSTSTSGTTSTTTGTTSITALPRTNSPGAHKAKAFASIVSIQLVATKSGRVLMVKIHSPNKTAKIQIRLINAKGKVITVVVRSVKANKRVQVPNLRIASNVKTVRVRLVS
jgi:hypothetical protein